MTDTKIRREQSLKNKNDHLASAFAQLGFENLDNVFLLFRAGERWSLKNSNF